MFRNVCTSLFPDLTITTMHDDFKQRHPTVTVCYETYQKVVDDIGINFAKLGQEECELCILYTRHEHDNAQVELCSKCAEWMEHNDRACLARVHYLADKDAPTIREYARFTTDMQKVIMLPAMPGVKMTFGGIHQAFAPLGTRTKAKPLVGIIWHKAAMLKMLHLRF
jgi:hypothetical protein